MSTIQEEVDAIKDDILKNAEALSWEEIFRRFNTTTWKSRKHDEERPYFDFVEFKQLLLKTLRDVLNQEEVSDTYTEKQGDAIYATLIEVLTNTERKRRCTITNKQESLVMLSTGDTYDPWAISAWMDANPKNYPPGMDQPINERDEQRIRSSTSLRSIASKAGLRGAAYGTLFSILFCSILIIPLGALIAFNPLIGALVIGAIAAISIIGCAAFNAYQHYSQAKLNKAAAEEAVKSYHPSKNHRSPTHKPALHSTATIARGTGASLDKKSDTSPMHRPTATSVSSTTALFGSPAAAAAIVGGAAEFDDAARSASPVGFHFHLEDAEGVTPSAPVQYSPLPTQI